MADPEYLDCATTTRLFNDGAKPGEALSVLVKPSGEHIPTNWPPDVTLTYRFADRETHVFPHPTTAPCVCGRHDHVP